MIGRQGNWEASTIAIIIILKHLAQLVVRHKYYMHFIGTGFTYLHRKSEMEKIVDAQTRTGTANCFLFIVVDKVSDLA